MKIVQTILASSRTMFARQFDICFYFVNNIVKQDLKMTKILAKTVINSLTIGPKR